MYCLYFYIFNIDKDYKYYFNPVSIINVTGDFTNMYWVRGKRFPKAVLTCTQYQYASKSIILIKIIMLIINITCVFVNEHLLMGQFFSNLYALSAFLYFQYWSVSLPLY